MQKLRMVGFCCVSLNMYKVFCVGMHMMSRQFCVKLQLLLLMISSKKYFEKCV